MAVKTCKKDCSPENKDKFLSEAGMPGGPTLREGQSLLSTPGSSQRTDVRRPGGVCSVAMVRC